MWLSFASQASAIAAEAAISANLGLPNKVTRTDRWALPARTASGEWAFLSPSDAALASVVGHVVKGYDVSWFVPTLTYSTVTAEPSQDILAAQSKH